MESLASAGADGAVVLWNYVTRQPYMRSYEHAIVCVASCHLFVRSLDTDVKTRMEWG